MYVRGRDMRYDGGSVLLEALLALPVLLLLTLGVGQLAHIWYCRQIVHYAAEAGARAAVVSSSGDFSLRARLSAREICSLISFTEETAGTRVTLPGIGEVPGSGDTDARLAGCTAEFSDWVMSCEVSMDVPLLFPVAGPVIGRVLTLFDGVEFKPSFAPGAGDGYASLRIRQKALVPKPFLSSWEGN